MCTWHPRRRGEKEAERNNVDEILANSLPYLVKTTNLQIQVVQQIQSWVNTKNITSEQMKLKKLKLSKKEKF